MLGSKTNIVQGVMVEIRGGTVVVYASEVLLVQVSGMLHHYCAYPDIHKSFKSKPFQINCLLLHLCKLVSSSR